MRCEDFPCCGHDICPDYDAETGAQLNMRCTCGAAVPLGGSSLCGPCLAFDPDDPYGDGDAYWHDDCDDDEEEDWSAEEESYLMDSPDSW